MNDLSLIHTVWRAMTIERLLPLKNGSAWRIKRFAQKPRGHERASVGLQVLSIFCFRLKQRDNPTT